MKIAKLTNKDKEVIFKKGASMLKGIEKVCGRRNISILLTRNLTLGGTWYHNRI